MLETAPDLAICISQRCHIWRIPEGERQSCFYATKASGEEVTKRVPVAISV
jgi:hypothetical protein